MSVLRQPQLVHSEYRFRTTMLFASLLCVLAVAGSGEIQVGCTIRERNRQEDQLSFAEGR